MKMNTTEHATMKDIHTLGHKVDKRTKTVYCVNDGRTWPSARACAKDIGVCYHAVISACNGDHKLRIGLTLYYEEDVAKLRDGETRMIQDYNAQIKKQDERIAELEPKAKEYDIIMRQANKTTNTRKEMIDRIAYRHDIQRRYHDTWRKSFARMNESVTELFDMCNHQATFVTELNHEHQHIKVNDHVSYDLEDQEFYFTM